MLSHNGSTHNIHTAAQTTLKAYIQDDLLRGIGNAPPGNLSEVENEIAVTLHEAFQLGGISEVQATFDRSIKTRYPEFADLLKRKLFHADALADLPPAYWLIENEIPEKGLTILYGASGSGKSFQALDYAEQISQHAPVVYIAAEGASGYSARHEAHKHHFKHKSGELYFYLDTANLLDQTALFEFIAEVGALKPKLIVIDTLARCMLGGDENSARDMGQFINACDILKTQLDTAVLVVHHTGKSGNGERGSSALRGAADMMIELSNEDGLIKLSCSKSKDSAGFETRYMRLVQVQVSPHVLSCVLVESDHVIVEDSHLSENQKSVIEWLSSSDIFDQGARSSDLMNATNIPKGSFYGVLKSLSRRGIIRKDGKYDPWLLTDKGMDIANQYGYTKNGMG